MPENRPITEIASFTSLRFRLRKDSDLQYISHLDFVRTMQKALVRTKLPLWYSQGFNPIPKIAFAAPLSVGTESDCELMDVRFFEPVSPDFAAEKLKASLPPHLDVLDCYVPESKLSDIGYLAYEIRIIFDGADEAAAARCREVLFADSLIISKKSKQGAPKDTDIKPMIAQATLAYDSESGELRGTWLLSAAPSAFLNPEHILTALRVSGALAQENVWYAIRRREVYTTDRRVFR